MHYCNQSHATTHLSSWWATTFQCPWEKADTTWWDYIWIPVHNTYGDKFKTAGTCKGNWKLDLAKLAGGPKRGQVASRGLGRAEGRFLGWLTVIERYQRQQARPDTEEISLFCQGSLQTKRRWGL